MLLKEVMRRTRLTRKQLRYLEERGLVGPVLRSDDRRIFTDAQVRQLELLSRLRDVGARLDEAAALASEWVGGESVVPDERLDDFLSKALEDNERRARLAQDLAEVHRRRRGGTTE